MHRLSSNLTMFYKLYLPSLTLSISFLFGLVLLIADNDNWYLFDGALPKVIYWVIILSILFIFWKTIMDLKRVEFDEDYFYITNYFKTVRIHHSAIDSITLSSNYLSRGSVNLKEKGLFGQRIRYVASPVGKKALRSLHNGLIK